MSNIPADARPYFARQATRDEHWDAYVAEYLEDDKLSRDLAEEIGKAMEGYFSSPLHGMIISAVEEAAYKVIKNMGYEDLAETWKAVAPESFVPFEIFEQDLLEPDPDEAYERWRDSF